MRRFWGDGTWFTVLSAEGKRSSLHRPISAELREWQRDRLERAGIRRIRQRYTR